MLEQLRVLKSTGSLQENSCLPLQTIALNTWNTETTMQQWGKSKGTAPFVMAVPLHASKD